MLEPKLKWVRDSDTPDSIPTALRRRAESMGGAKPLESAVLPTKGRLTFAYGTSLAIVALMVVACVVGLFETKILYPSNNQFRSSIPTDLVNLLGMPLLLGSMWLARSGRLVGLLLWPGALLYLMYHDLAFLFSIPFSAMFLLHLVVAGLNLFAMMVLFANIDGRKVQQVLTGVVAEKAGGGVLAGFGVLFFAGAAYLLISAFFGRITLPPTERAVRITDLLMSPAWIIGGVLLWQRKALGYVTGLGLLFQACMLFVGLIVLFVLQPFITGSQFRLVDVLVIFAMSLFCIVPFCLFVCGAAGKRLNRL